MLNWALLLCISNTRKFFERFKTNVIYLDIMVVKKNRLITNTLFKAFLTKHKLHLNYYGLIKPRVSQISSQLQKKSVENSIIGHI